MKFRLSLKQGFTLIEIIVVLVIIGVTSAYVASRIINSDAEIITETEILKTHLRYAQSLALTNNVSGWQIFFSGSSYTLQKEAVKGSGDWTAPVFLPGESTATRNTGFSLNLGSDPNADSAIQFDEWGSPRNSNVITVTDGVSSKTITVTANTGFIN